MKMVISVSTNRRKSLLSCYNCFGGHNNKQPKVLQIAAGFAGVDMVAYVGNNKDKIEVAGDGVDAVKLTTKLKKKVGFAELESLTKEKGGSDDKKKKEDDKKDGANKPLLALPPPPVWSYGPHHPYAICNCY